VLEQRLLTALGTLPEQVPFLSRCEAACCWKGPSPEELWPGPESQEDRGTSYLLVLGQKFGCGHGQLHAHMAPERGTG
jgi:hypothetical protein